MENKPDLYVVVYSMDYAENKFVGIYATLEIAIKAAYCEAGNLTTSYVYHVTEWGSEGKLVWSSD